MIQTPNKLQQTRFWGHKKIRVVSNSAAVVQNCTVCGGGRAKSEIPKLKCGISER